MPDPMLPDPEALLAPATPMAAPALGTRSVTLDGIEMSLRPNIGLRSQPISFIGPPVVAVPVWPGARPTGVQVNAAPWREGVALRAARALEADRVARALEADGAARSPIAPNGA